MTRKDYLLIAAALKRAKLRPYGVCSDWPAGADHGAAEAHRVACETVAYELGQDNPRNFDRTHFLYNCGVIAS
jgi:hypothetical protein